MGIYNQVIGVIRAARLSADKVNIDLNVKPDLSLQLLNKLITAAMFTLRYHGNGEEIKQYTKANMKMRENNPHSEELFTCL